MVTMLRHTTRRLFIYWMYVPHYLFNEGGDVLLDVVFLQSLCGALHSILLHVVRHVGVFDHCLPFRHGCSGKHNSDTS